MILHHHNKHPFQDQRGFSMIEMLVTMTIFAVIMIAVGTTFIQISKSQRRGFNAQVVQENGMLILENMARAIRVSQLCTDSDGDNDCDTFDSPSYNCTATFAQSLSLQHPVNGYMRFSLNGGIVQVTSGGVTADLSSSQVSFSRLNFCVAGGGTADGQQSRVAILAQIKSAPTTAKDVFTIDLETMVSSRDLSEITN